jgi:hypothetical protein
MKDWLGGDDVKISCGGFENSYGSHAKYAMAVTKISYISSEK